MAQIVYAKNDGLNDFEIRRIFLEISNNHIDDILGFFAEDLALFKQIIFPYEKSEWKANLLKKCYETSLSRQNIK